MSIFPWRLKKKKKELINKMMNPDNSQNTSSQYSPWLMKIGKSPWVKGILLGLVVFLFGYSSYVYNKFVTFQQDVNNMKAQIETCLQRRENLIPVLQIAVSDFVKHEDDIFLHAADARAKSIQQQGKIPEGKKPAGGELEQWLARLFAVAERYPDLKVSPSFEILMAKVAETEKDILEKRIEYNNAAFELNRYMKTIPSSVVAWLFGFKRAPYFEWQGKPEWITTMISATETRKGTD